MFRKKKRNSTFFVSIGAGLNQLPLIKEAKKLGFHVIGVDANYAAPGFVNCDLKIQESINNQEDIYTKLRELMFDGEIAGIMTKSYGTAIKTTSFLTQKFKIDFLPFKTTDVFIDKKKMKSVFSSYKIPTPEQLSFTLKTPVSKIENFLPVITKPQTGHAKIDVELIRTPEELKKIISSKKNGLIFEKFIEGDEIIVIGLTHKGKFHLVDITDKITTEPPYFVDVMHISPSKYYYLKNKIVDLGQKISNAFQIITSPIIMEIIVDKNDNLFLIEAVPEFGGEFIPDVLIPNRTGYNFIGQSIRALTDRGFKPPMRKKEKNSCVVKYITGTNGTLLSCNPEGPGRIKGTVFSRIFKIIGSEVKKPATNLDRLGVVVTKGKSVEEAVQIAEKSVESFNIRIK